MRFVVEGCAIATVDAAGTEHGDGHLVVEDGRITAVGEGAANTDGARIDGRGMLATPGLVNCHHHLYQWATRGLSQQATLFEWLQDLYPVWARVDAEVERAAARAGLAALARSGCSTSTDHHYVFPRAQGDLLQVEIEAARELHLRFHACRGSMDLGRSQGGLPPDEITEDRDAILSACAEAIDAFHDPAPGAMVRIALAPCSPFSVTRELMAESAEYARTRGVRLHTHMAETLDEEQFCLELFGVRPVEYLEQVGWLGDDVWLAHCVHLDEREVRRFGETGTGVAHCPTSNLRLGSGTAPVRAMLEAGVPVGLGVDGSASNDSSNMLAEARQALLAHRLGAEPEDWITAEEVLFMATRGGARCLGRDDVGSLEPGKAADVVLVDTRRLSYAGAGSDPLAALVFSPWPEPVDTVMVGGRIVVEGGVLRGVDVPALVEAAEKVSASLLDAAHRATGRDYRRRE